MKIAWLLLFPLTALGQVNICNIPPPVDFVYYTDISKSAVGKFSCIPEPGGPGKGMTIKTNLKGGTAWWYCPDNAAAPTKWTLVFAAGTWDRIATGNLTPDTPLADPSLTPVWCPHWPLMMANRPVAPVAPVPGQWLTAGLSTFNSVNGALGGFAGLTTKGRVCDCSKPLVIGTVTYCTFTGAASPTVVAQCQKV